MKDFLRRNERILIISITLVTITSIICVTSFSYALENSNNQIFTRDELSERVLPENLFLSVYPVGSIYISVDSTSPSTLYGGTWEIFGKGNTLVGVDTTQTEFDMVEKVGGEKEHTLSITEMPSHWHVSRMYLNQPGLGHTILPDYSHYDWLTNFNSIISYSDSTITDVNLWNIGKSSSEGGSQAHNNLQPYITVYMWKRMA